MYEHFNVLYSKTIELVVKAVNDPNFSGDYERILYIRTVTDPLVRVTRSLERAIVQVYKMDDQK